MEPNYKRQMRVGEQCTSGGRKLLMTVFIKAEVKPRAFVLGFRLTHNALYVFVTTGRATHDAIRPTHLFDIFKTLLFGGKLYEDFLNAHGFGMNSQWHVQTIAK